MDLPGMAGDAITPPISLEAGEFLSLSSFMLKRSFCSLSTALLFLLSTVAICVAEFSDIPTKPTPGDAMLAQYFEIETRRVTNRSLASIKNADDWNLQKSTYRRQLFEMLGLQPLPARSDLKAEVTGSTEREGVIVENILFQSRPGLYVTANFYRPAEQDGPLPTILYVCGHGRVKIDGVSYGNKVNYQHHGTWFAKNGYTCLTIDTLQLGEIEAIHHGTHNLNRWWWNSRGYTPAGVEAWNEIRALDYLETRDEVDKEKFGVTGRSGGGASTFWVAALDDRIKVAAPVAGITSMKNHVVDGCVEGHCDCMFMLNTYRWDFPILSALIAPRPQLILNTDNDRIFPLDGVVDVYSKARSIYKMLDHETNLGLAIYEGPHKDTQPLRVPAFHWFERHLKGKKIDHEMENTVAPKIFEPAELKVLKETPGNERNTIIDDYFTQRVPRKQQVPESLDDWNAQHALTLSRLKSKSFRGWPANPGELSATVDTQRSKEGLTLSVHSFNSQAAVRLPFYVIHNEKLKPEDLELLVLNVLDEEGWNDFLESTGASFFESLPDEELPDLNTDRFKEERDMLLNRKWGMVYFPPRGIGPTAWTTDPKEQIHIRRRFALLGQTLDGMRVWDIRRSISALRSFEGMQKPQLWIQAKGNMAGNALYASIFEKDIHRLDLHQLPASHRDGPTYLNVLRFTDIPQVTAMAAQSSQIRIYSDEKKEFQYVTDAVKRYEWPENQFQIREISGEGQ